MQLCGAFRGDMYDQDGKLQMTRATGKDWRKLMQRYRFGVSGVFPEEYQWVMTLLIDWVEFTDLCRLVNAANEEGLCKLTAMIPRIQKLLLQLYQAKEQKKDASLARQYTFHTLEHIPDAIRSLGSLPEQSTDQFEHVHGFLKAIFIECTNHSNDEEELVPQMMRSLAIRLCQPDVELRPRIPEARQYPSSARLVSPGRVLPLSAVMDELNESLVSKSLVCE